MIERGKYQSLTLINWNGFFARTFDLDALVTTLSGGNGAGKSTTMAALITALIPDQSLLHFRNTTEAGSAQASKDKGLYGKLQPGVCYAVLSVKNSRQQRLLFGVRLQQVAGRDKKVDIKPFLIQGLADETPPLDLLIERLDNTTARVPSLAELKNTLNEAKLSCTVFNTVADYHAQLFELGVLPKKLRTSSDRAKFYRLIEASLYGGISSTITRSLRDYLLPQNTGVKQAFQDMESALRENRLTLAAIKTTQQDRDLFKHLILQTTHYVAADYMRHTNERRQHILSVLALRREKNEAVQALNEYQNQIVLAQQALAQLNEQEIELEQQQQSVITLRHQLAQALQQRQKMERYQDDLFELNERLVEQNYQVEERHFQYQDCQDKVQEAEHEVDSVRHQLANQQQALDEQQTRILQYQQAINALEKAREQVANQQLELADIPELTTQLTQQQAKQTQQLLTVKHQWQLANAADEQFEEAYHILTLLEGEMSRERAVERIRYYAQQWQQSQYWQTQAAQSQAEYQALTEQLSTQKALKADYDAYQQAHGVHFQQQSDVEQEIELQQAKVQEHEIRLAELTEHKHQLQLELQTSKERLLDCQKQALPWAKATQALEELAQLLAVPLTDANAVFEQMQQLVDKEKTAIKARDELAHLRQKLDDEINALSSLNAGTDPRLHALAQQLNGTLLSDIYDDILLEDAPYFSALYGPARQAIVVPDLALVTQQQWAWEDYPDDIYLIEGNPDAFDDRWLQAKELDGGLCVQVNARQWRYSRLPKEPLFGRAAREKQLTKLRVEREQVLEAHAKQAFDAQKYYRAYQQLQRFIAEHVSWAFIDDPIAQQNTIEQQLSVLERQLNQINESYQQSLQALRDSQQAINSLKHWLNNYGLLIQTQLESRQRQAAQQWQQWTHSQTLLKEQGHYWRQLAEFEQVLAVDPTQLNQLTSEYEHANHQLQLLNAQLFALQEVMERRRHFTYSDAQSLVSQSHNLSEQLKNKLDELIQWQSKCREELNIAQQQWQQEQQLLMSLKAAYQAKSETVRELEQELASISITHSVQAIQAQQEEIERSYAQLITNIQQLKQQHNAEQHKLTSSELAIEQYQKQLKKAQKAYKELRKQQVIAKMQWQSVLVLARQYDVERRLVRKEFSVLSAEQLRSISDKALGALRLAVAKEETLRDALRLSEDTRHPERKVLFYIEVDRYLRQRIRQDIIHSEDPIEAIEEMEIELARLTEELTQREANLAMSSEAVANIIRKTIMREQNRIRLLNQGLSQMSFGQVTGVRLTVQVRESHQKVLDALVVGQEQHQDVLNHAQYSFSQAMTKLFQRVNPHIELGQRSPQLFGEELLDYRNYLELNIEVNRGNDGWLQAESGALSTGEAIGTGQSILLMVVQSWEDESRHWRAKDILPCRLLFLDEASRLDSKSIATLFELCGRLDMQLLIAAPENISPERGTTYKLVRKVVQGQEHVHVIGLKGFERSANKPDPDTMAS